MENFGRRAILPVAARKLWAEMKSLPGWARKWPAKARLILLCRQKPGGLAPWACTPHRPPPGDAARGPYLMRLCASLPEVRRQVQRLQCLPQQGRVAGAAPELHLDILQLRACEIDPKHLQRWPCALAANCDSHCSELTSCTARWSPCARHAAFKSCSLWSLESTLSASLMPAPSGNSKTC